MRAKPRLWHPLCISQLTPADNQSTCVGGHTTQVGVNRFLCIVSIEQRRWCWRHSIVTVVKWASVQPLFPSSKVANLTVYISVTSHFFSQSCTVAATPPSKHCPALPSGNFSPQFPSQSFVWGRNVYIFFSSYFLEKIQVGCLCTM